VAEKKPAEEAEKVRSSPHWTCWPRSASGLCAHSPCAPQRRPLVHQQWHPVAHSGMDWLGPTDQRPLGLAAAHTTVHAAQRRCNVAPCLSVGVVRCACDRCTLKAVLFPLGERTHALQAKAAKKVGAEKAQKAETEKAKKPEKAKAATDAEAKPAKKAKQAEQSQAAAETATEAEMKFAVASGLAAVFGALNLNVDVRVRCLARTVQWFQELGVRRHGSRCATARR
jgi:hypothetical protein